MPRIVDSDNNNVDLCSGCYALDVADVSFLTETYGASYDLNVEHPPYSLDDYRCESCQKQLTDRDN